MLTILSLALFLAPQAVAPKRCAEVTASTKYGPIAFLNLGVSQDSVTAQVDNRSETGWEPVRFVLTLKGPEGSKSINNTINKMARGETARLLSVPEGAPFQPERCFILMVGGVPRSPRLEGSIRALEHDAMVAEAAQREQERIATERSKMLASAPKLDSGTGPVLLGADKKCLDQAIEASKMEGLEKRKKIAELAGYGCVFTVDRLPPVRVEGAEGGFSRVTPIDGPKAGHTGWVLSSWLRKPAE